jgi:hypothetical protein
MASVFIAVSSGAGGFSKLVVVKQLLPDLAGEQEFLTVFLDEARLSARLAHRNVVQVHEAGGQIEGLPFLVMEYLNGQALSRLLGRAGWQRMPLALAVMILSPLKTVILQKTAAGKPAPDVWRRAPAAPRRAEVARREPPAASTTAPEAAPAHSQKPAETVKVIGDEAWKPPLEVVPCFPTRDRRSTEEGTGESDSFSHNCRERRDGPRWFCAGPGSGPARGVRA